MGASVKIAISLPREEFARVERWRKRNHKSRSAAIREAVRAWFAKEAEQEDVRRYIESYRRYPESIPEMRAFEQASYPAIEALEWT